MLRWQVPATAPHSLLSSASLCSTVLYGSQLRSGQVHAADANGSAFNIVVTISAQRRARHVIGVRRQNVKLVAQIRMALRVADRSVYRALASGRQGGQLAQSNGTVSMGRVPQRSAESC